MSSDKAAEGFQQNSTPIRERGQQFVQNEVKPCKGDVILDLGCGTGAVRSLLILPSLLDKKVKFWELILTRSV